MATVIEEYKKKLPVGVEVVTGTSQAEIYPPDWKEQMKKERHAALKRLSDRNPVRKSVCEGDGDGDENVYNYGNGKPGLAVIINNNIFMDLGRNRLGSCGDVVSLCNAFIKFGFDIFVCIDLSAADMVLFLEEVKEVYNHNEANCFACTIMTHGCEGSGTEPRDVLEGVDGVKVETQILLDIFANCEGLKGKPRLFFVQACRGVALDDGVFVTHQNNTAGGDEQPDDSNTVDSQPVGPHQDVPTPRYCFTNLYVHCLLMHASPPGFSAMRNPNNGTWFVQSLCDVLARTSGPYPLLSLLTEVVSDVATRQSQDGTMQVPVIETRLCKDVILHPAA